MWVPLRTGGQRTVSDRPLLTPKGEEAGGKALLAESRGTALHELPVSSLLVPSFLSGQSRAADTSLWRKLLPLSYHTAAQTDVATYSHQGDKSPKNGHGGGRAFSHFLPNHCEPDELQNSEGLA